MSSWFEQYAASRPHDFAVGPAGNPYMLRWFITPRGDEGGIYLHRFLHDDEDRAFHDHPWDSISLMLSGEIRELRPDAEPALYRPGDVIVRKAPYPHRLQVIEPGYTLFIMGPRIREWGFLCAQGWRHWTRFVDQVSPGEISAGCEGYGAAELERTPLQYGGDDAERVRQIRQRHARRNQPDAAFGLADGMVADHDLGVLLEIMGRRQEGSL